MSLEILGVVQARGGSKGVPGKNIKPLAGKPLMAWMIENAKNTKHITRLVCSTDSSEYAAIARQYGAETPFLRPSEFATDTANDIHVLTHALTWLKDRKPTGDQVLPSMGDPLLNQFWQTYLESKGSGDYLYLLAKRT